MLLLSVPLPITDLRNEPGPDTARAADHHLLLPTSLIHRRPGASLEGLVPGRQSNRYYMHDNLQQNLQ